MQVLLSEITIPERRQRHEVGDIAELADSIKSLGLIHPLVIDRNNTLIAGFRRYSACKFWAGLALIVTLLTSLILLFFI
jgi:ParB family chromosome partitioning protein